MARWLGSGTVRTGLRRSNGEILLKFFAQDFCQLLSRDRFLLLPAMHGFDVTAHTPTGEKRIHLVAINECVALKLAKRAFGDHPLTIRKYYGPTRRHREQVRVMTDAYSD